MRANGSQWFLYLSSMLALAGGVDRLLDSTGDFGPCLGRAWVAPEKLMGFELQVWKVDDVRECLGSFKMNLHDMYVTMDNLFLGVANVYSFTTIVANTTASVQRTACDLEVHPLAIDLLTELDEVYSHVVLPADKASARRLEELFVEDPAARAERLADALEAPTEVGALAFHSMINEVFSRLQDAHTQYNFISGVLQALPVEFSVKPRAGGGLEVWAEHASVTATALGLDGQRARVLPAGPARQVVQIDGAPPLAFLQRVADRLGTYLDPGARLNAILFHAPLAQANAQLSDGLVCIVGAMCDLAPEGNTTVRFDFADGSHSVVDIVATLNLQLTASNFEKVSPEFVYLDAQVRRKVMWKKRVKADCEMLEGCNPDGFGQFGKHIGRNPYGSMAARSGRMPRVAARRLLPDVDGGVFEDAVAIVARRREARMNAKAATVAADSKAVAGTAGAGKVSRRLQPKVYGLDAKISIEEPDETRGWSTGPFYSFEFVAEDDGPTSKAGQCLAQAASEANATGAQVLYVAKNRWGEDWVSVIRVDDMLVLKLQTMGGDPILSFLDAAMTAWRELVIYARAHKIKRLLLDLVSNLGGLVALSDMLQSLILKNYNPRSLCNVYDERINDYWRAWVESYGRGIDQSIVDHLYVLDMYSQVKSFEVCKLYAYAQAVYLLELMNTSNKVLGHAFGCKETELDCCADGTVAWRCHGDVIVDLTKIEYWVKRVNQSSSKTELLSIMRETLPQHHFIPRSLFAGSDMYSMQGSMNGNTTAPVGWFPFTGDEILQPDSLMPWPKMTGILDTVRQHWGGQTTKLSQKGIFKSCPKVVACKENLEDLLNHGLPDLRDYVDHPFTDVGIVTDGLAGSAASAVASRLQASKRVTVFSYGGLGEDTPLDTSAFAGGNVLNYQEWWPRVALAAELGMWLLPNRTWEATYKNFTLFADNPNLHGHHVREVCYPFAMPIEQATARFNFNMMYIKEFAAEGDPTQLPRQFYRIPAHRQYHRWPKRLNTICGNPAELLDLYQTIQGEDWFKLRREPQFLGKGWSSACIPDESERKCCAVVENVPVKKEPPASSNTSTIIIISIIGGLLTLFVANRVLHAIHIAAGRKKAERQNMAAPVRHLTRAVTHHVRRGTTTVMGQIRRGTTASAPSGLGGGVGGRTPGSGVSESIYEEDENESDEEDDDNMRMGPMPSGSAYPPMRGSITGTMRNDEGED